MALRHQIHVPNFTISRGQRCLSDVGMNSLVVWTCSTNKLSIQSDLGTNRRKNFHADKLSQKNIPQRWRKIFLFEVKTNISLSDEVKCSNFDVLFCTFIQFSVHFKLNLLLKRRVPPIPVAGTYWNQIPIELLAVWDTTYTPHIYHILPFCQFTSLPIWKVLMLNFSIHRYFPNLNYGVYVFDLSFFKKLKLKQIT